MTPDQKISDLERLAQMHLNRLLEDVGLSKTREEHVRQTARANEAAQLLIAVTDLTNNG